MVVFDPDREVTLSRAVLHENCDYTPYEGMKLKGYPALTMLRGSVIAQDGQFVGARMGRYLRADLTDFADLAGRSTGGA